MEFPNHPSREYVGSGQGAADLCRGVQSQARGPMWSCQRIPTVHGPTDDHQWVCNVMEASLLGPVEEPRTPTLEEEAALLGGGARTSGGPGPAPQQGKTVQCVGLAKQTAAPFTFITPCHCPSLKRGKSWEGINIFYIYLLYSHEAYIKC